MKLSIIIPCFNQRNVIVETLKSLNNIPEKIDKEIILVDDRSRDDFREFLRDHISNKVNILALHKSKGGRAAALRTGLSQATGEIILLLDFGVNYQPEDYLTFLKPILELNADIVWVPYSYKTNSLPVGSFWIFFWNRFLTVYSNFFNNINLTHFRAGGILFNKKFFNRIVINQDRGLLEPQLLSLFVEAKSQIYEINIQHNHLAKSLSFREYIYTFYSILKYHLFSK